MKKQKFNLCIILSVILTIVLFFLFKNEHFALDTYTFELDVKKNAYWYLTNGRFLMTLYLYICLLLNISCKTIKFVSLIISLISLFISNIVLTKMAVKYIKNKNIASLISTCIIYSPFIFEFFIFTEYTGIMSFGLLMSILASNFLQKYFEERKIKYILLSLLFAFLSVSSYQGVIGCFVSITSLYIVINYKNIKEFIIQNVYMFSIYGIVSLISLIITKICGLARISTTGYKLIETLKGVASGTSFLILNTSYVYPKYYYFLILILMVLLIVFLCIKTSKLKNIWLTIYLVVLVILISVAPQFLVKYSSIWIVPRSNIPLSMLFGILCFWYNSQIEENTIYLKFNIFVIILTLVLQLIGWYQISMDQYYVNKLDKVFAESISTKIREYEKENNIAVTKIGISGDKAIMYTYKDVETMSGDVNVRASSISWVVPALLEYYDDKGYQSVDASEDIIEYCSSKNWNSVSIEQLKFVGDTLYICIY